MVPVVPNDLVDADNERVFTVGSGGLLHVHDNVDPERRAASTQHAHCHHATHFVA